MDLQVLTIGQQVHLDVTSIKVNQPNKLQDDFYSLIYFFYTYLYCRKCNAEFNKLIKTVAHCAIFFFLNDKTLLTLF